MKPSNVRSVMYRTGFVRAGLKFTGATVMTASAPAGNEEEEERMGGDWGGLDETSAPCIASEGKDQAFVSSKDAVIVKVVLVLARQVSSRAPEMPVALL